MTKLVKIGKDTFIEVSLSDKRTNLQILADYKLARIKSKKIREHKNKVLANFIK